VSSIRKIAHRTARRALRVREKLTTTLPRVSIFRSSKHIYAQIIDDNAQATLVSYSSLALENPTGDKKAIAYAVGKELAQRASAKGISTAAFDRGSFRFHGRIKSLAEGLREGGLHI
jgi:large subunit ribosomal protein L18